jgi:type II secretion system protein C
MKNKNNLFSSLKNKLLGRFKKRDQKQNDIDEFNEETGTFSHDHPESNPPPPPTPNAPRPKASGQNIKGKVQDLFGKFKTSGNGPSKGELLEKAKAFILSLDYNSALDKIFSPGQRPKIHKYFINATVVLSTYFSAQALSLWLSPAPRPIPSKQSSSSANNSSKVRKQMAAIQNSGLFKAQGSDNGPKISNIKKQKPKIDQNLICKVAKSQSSLPLTLITTTVLQDSVKSLASVQVRGKKGIISFREGEKVQSLAQIGSIQGKRVVLKNLKSGRCEYIENKKAKKRPTKSPIKIERDPKKGKKLLANSNIKGIVNEGDTFKIKKDVRDKLLENISEVMTQARAIQIKNPDGTLAFRMQEIVPGSIYSQLNIKDGDIITGINGKRFTNINELMSLFGQLKDIDHFEIGLKREGKAKNLEYDFE